jgi:hypothetical protein
VCGENKISYNGSSIYEGRAFMWYSKGRNLEPNPVAGLHQGTVAPPFINTLLAVRAGLLKQNFQYETKSKIQMER